MPGERGNAAIAGHRTTYGAPFYRLDELEAGDPIFVTTVAGRFRYEVRQSMVVTPEDVWVLDATEDSRLTLTTCHPRFSAALRLVVVAELMTPPASSRPVPTATARDELLPGEPRPDTAPVRLSGQAAPRAPAVAWGGAAAAVWLGAALAARRRSRWVVYGIALAPFLVALLGFFASIARLLPADV